MQNSHEQAISVGSVTKKLLSINPDLGAPDLIAIIRQSTRVSTEFPDEFTQTLIVDEEKAAALARSTLS